MLSRCHERRHERTLSRTLDCILVDSMMIMVGGIDGRFRRERVVKRTVQGQVKDRESREGQDQPLAHERRPVLLAVL